MKDSTAVVKPMNHRKKRSHSSSDISVSSEASSNSDQGSFHRTKSTVKSKSPETIQLSSDSDSSLILVRKSKKKKKKHKHIEVSDLEEPVQVIHSRHNGKRHRHRCHHHGHHRHHKMGYSHGSKDKEVRVHKRTCSKHRMALGVIKIKEEPVDEDGRTRHSHASHRRRRRAKSEETHADQQNSYSCHPETSSTSRSRPREERENSHHRKETHSGRNEQDVNNERQPEEKRKRRSEEREREVRGSKNEKKNNNAQPQGRQNRRGNEERNILSTNRPVKQEPHSEGEFEWGKRSDGPKEEKKDPSGQKQKPNFGLSGKLAEDTNTFNGVVIKYSEPPEARKPKRRWRFYPFKGDQGLPTLYIHRQSSYLIGRDRKVADIPVDHPSCSKQHAALQYRLVPFERVDGTMGKRVRPYIIDLESANGTYVNNVKIEPKTYVELLEKDVIKFGYSSREYVLLHEQSKDEDLDDDVAGGGNE